jgi:hypothetical protein
MSVKEAQDSNDIKMIFSVSLSLLAKFYLGTRITPGFNKLLLEFPFDYFFSDERVLWEGG